MLTYIGFFFSIIWYTLGAIVICGLTVSLCHTAFVRLLGGGAGRVAVRVTSALGTPIHELGHAVMCLLFGHRIVKMSLWNPRSEDGSLGYVTHSYNPRNPYHVLGNLFIGIGPILSGFAVIALVLRLCFPGVFQAYASVAQALVSANVDGLTLCWETLRLLPHILRDAFVGNAVPIWARIVGLITLLSVSLHIHLSPADIKGALKAIPLYLVPVLILTVICACLGTGAIATVREAFSLLFIYTLALFAPVLVLAVAQVLIALPIGLVRWIVRRNSYGLGD